MTQTEIKELEKLKYRLNLILIAFLCSTTLAPCVIFYFRGEGQLKWMLIFIGISYLVSRLPTTFYDRFQISEDVRIYKLLGVDKFKQLSTNGDLINRRIRKKYPTHRNIINFETIKEKLNEKRHLSPMARVFRSRPPPELRARCAKPAPHPAGRDAAGQGARRPCGAAAVFARGAAGSTDHRGRIHAGLCAAADWHGAGGRGGGGAADEV